MKITSLIKLKNKEPDTPAIADTKLIKNKHITIITITIIIISIPVPKSAKIFFKLSKSTITPELKVFIN